MTPKEFKKRWESDDPVVGITWDDVAKCAKDWGLYDKPKVHDMETVLRSVLDHAQVTES